MTENPLQKIEDVLKAVKNYQKTSLSGDFEGRQLETRWPDIEGAFKAIESLKETLKKIEDIEKNLETTSNQITDNLNLLKQII